MNDPSLESYCNVLYEFAISSFAVISGNFALSRHLTAFLKIPRIKSGIVPHMLVYVLMKFGSDWAIFYLFMTSNVHPFFTTFFADQPWASSSLVVSDHWSSNCYYFSTTHPFHINDPSLESYDVAFYGFLCFRCLYQQCVHLWAKHLCTHNLLTYR